MGISTNALPTGSEAAILFWITFGTLIFIGITLIFLVYATRRSLLFGVRIPDSQTRAPEVLALKNRYYALIVILTAVVLGAFYFLGMGNARMLLILSLVIYFPYMLLQGAVYIYCWKKALALKAEKGWDTSEVLTASLAFRKKSAGTDVRIPWAWYLVAIVIIGVTAVLTLMKYTSLPAIIPTHYNFAMQPDDWAPKSVWSVFAMPLVAVGTGLLMIGSTWMIYRQKMQIDYENPALSYAQHRAYRTLMGHLMGLMNLTLVPLFVVAQLLMIQIIPEKSASAWMIVSMIIMSAGVLYAVFAGMRAGQGGGNMKPEILPEDSAMAYGADAVKQEALITPEMRKLAASRQDDRYWKLGMFYYNPEDPTLLIEDRFGVNTGLNYGRKAAWAITAGLIILIVASIGLPLWFLL